MLLLSIILLLVSWETQGFHSPRQRWSPAYSLVRPSTQRGCTSSSLIMKATAIPPPVLSHRQSLQLLKNTVVTKVGTISTMILPKLVVWTRRYLIALSMTFLFMFITNSTVRSGVADVLLSPFRRIFKNKPNRQEEDRNIHADHSDFYYNGNVGDKDTPPSPPTAPQITVTGKGYNTVAKEMEVLKEREPIAIKQPVIIDEVAWAKKKRTEMETARKAALEKGRIREEAARRAQLEALKKAERKQLQLAIKVKQQAEENARMIRQKEEEANRLLRQKEEEAIAQKKLEAEELAKKQRREAEKEVALRRVVELRQQEAHDMLLTKQRMEDEAKATKQGALVHLAVGATTSAVNVVENTATISEAAVTSATMTDAAILVDDEVSDIEIRPDIASLAEESSGFEINDVARSISSFYDKLMGKENSDTRSEKQMKSRNYSPFQTTEKTVALQKQAMAHAQDIKNQRGIAEKKSRSFSPFPKKQSSSPSSKLPYAASKTFDDIEIQSLSSLGKSFLGSLIHELTTQNENEVLHVQEEVSGGNDKSAVNSDGGMHDDMTPSIEIETRNYSPFQETDKTVALRKQALEATVRLRRQQEINETLATKLRIERTVAEKKSRNYSPFVKQQSTTSYSSTSSSSGLDYSDVNQDAEWAPGKAVHR